MVRGHTDCGKSNQGKTALGKEPRMSMGPKTLSDSTVNMLNSKSVSARKT